MWKCGVNAYFWSLHTPLKGLKVIMVWKWFGDFFSGFYCTLPDLIYSIVSLQISQLNKDYGKKFAENRYFRKLKKFRYFQIQIKKLKSDCQIISNNPDKNQSYFAVNIIQMHRSPHKLESKQKILSSKKINRQNIYQTLSTQASSTFQQFNSSKNQLFQPTQNKLQTKPQNSNFYQPQTVHLQIELDDGKVEIIVPKQGDNPSQLAKIFCQKYQLAEQMVSLLTENIKKTIDKILKVNNKVQKKKQSESLAQMNLVHIQNKLNIDFDVEQNKFQRMDKEFQKKKQRKKIEQQYNKIKQYLGSNDHSPKINQISKEIMSKKLKHKSIQKQSQNYQRKQKAKTQKVRKTQPSKVTIRNISQFQNCDHKQDQEQSIIFDYQNQTHQKKQVKKRQHIKAFLQRNCNIQPQINKRSIKNSSDKTLHPQINKSASNSKDTFQKTFKKSKQKNQYSSKRQISNQGKALINYSLVNLTSEKENRKKIHIRTQSSCSNNFRLQQGFQKEKQRYSHQFHTDKLYQNQKSKAFRSIFSLLDDDKDGVISILKINLMIKIQHRLIRVLFPVLEEMQILETELSEEEFCKALNKLFTSLSLDEKAYILRYCQHHQQKEIKKNIERQNLQQPRMSPISLSLVKQTERGNFSIYEYSKIREQLKKQKLEQQRIQKQKIMMRDCTFHPKVNSKKIIYF